MHVVELALQAPSLEAMRRYYGALLGLPAVVDSEDEVVFRAGETQLAFRPAEQGSAPSYHFALRVPWSRFGEAKTWLGSHTLLLEHEGEDELDWSFWDARACYFADPAGNVGELIAFDGIEGDGLVLGLAEVGLPVAEVSTAVEALTDAFGIGFWDREEIGSGITPVGVRGATFILVPVGRTWFLGGPATDSPLGATLEGVHPGTLELGHARLTAV